MLAEDFVVGILFTLRGFELVLCSSLLLIIHHVICFIKKKNPENCFFKLFRTVTHCNVTWFFRSCIHTEWHLSNLHYSLLIKKM